MKAQLKKVYKKIPFKKQLYSVIRHFWLPPQKIYQHLHFDGEFEVRINRVDSFKMIHYGYQIENEIFWSGLNGGWEKQSIQLWTMLCKTSDVIIDIGANTGIYGLIAGCVNPKAEVYCFEPVNRVFDKLLRNIKINKYPIQSFNQAVSDYDGTAVIFDPSTEHVYSVTVNKNLALPDTPVNEVQVETISLNTFIRSHKLKKVDLIKIDVETHEPEVLQGFSDYLYLFLPTMLIEILNDKVALRIETLLKDLNYLYFNIDERGFIRQTPGLIKSDYYNYLICTAATAKNLGLI